MRRGRQKRSCIPGGWSDGVTGGCELQNQSTENRNLGKLLALLTAEPSLQPGPQPCTCLSVLHPMALTHVLFPSVLFRSLSFCTQDWTFWAGLKLSYYLFPGEEEAEPGTASTSESNPLKPGARLAAGLLHSPPSPARSYFSRQLLANSKQMAWTDSMSKIHSHPGSFSDHLKSHFSWFRTRSPHHYQIFASFEWSVRKCNRTKHEKICRNLGTVLRVDCTKKS